MNEENKKRAEDLVHVDFSGLMLGFSSAALYHLGQLEVEDQQKSKLNLPLALQNIEIVRLLKKKTSGNLTTDEAELISTVLNDLQEKYAKVQSSAAE
jgi:hypothetical protein